MASTRPLSPKWLDPQVAPASRTPYGTFLQAVFDPLIGAMPNGLFVYLLAEDLEMTDDFKKATFRLREGITFHNGEPVTTEDVKFSYENYSGANADIYQDKTERIEIVDERTITSTSRSHSLTSWNCTVLKPPEPAL